MTVYKVRIIEESFTWQYSVGYFEMRRLRKAFSKWGTVVEVEKIRIKY